MTDFTTGESAYQDGNVLAGPFSEFFTVDVTRAHTTCASCGRHARLAELRVYTAAPGMIARCAGCGEVVARHVRTPDAAWLDFRGTIALTIPLASTPNPEPARHAREPADGGNG